MFSDGSGCQGCIHDVILMVAYNSCPSAGSYYTDVLIGCPDNSAMSSSGMHSQAVTHFAVAGMYAGLALAPGVVRLVDLQKVSET